MEAVRSLLSFELDHLTTLQTKINDIIINDNLEGHTLHYFHKKRQHLENRISLLQGELCEDLVA